MAMTHAQILDEAAMLKKRADIHFAKGQYDDAVVTYTFALKRLAFLAGLPFGEILVARCFSNQAQCFLKMNQYDKALASINMGFTVPSTAQDTHMLSKLYLRKATALEALHHYEEALKCVDKAIALGIKTTENLDELREKAIKNILSQEGQVIPIPPKPVPLIMQVVSGLITHILLSKGDPNKIAPLLSTVVKQRAWFDQPDDRKNNIMWGLAQAAVVRAQESSMNADDVYDLLELIIVQGEAKAEQRFSNIGNKTPLQIFAMAGAVNCVQLLLKNGASVHTLDDDGWSPLVVACAVNSPCSGHNSAIVDLLIKSRSNINHRTRSGLSAIAAAAQADDELSVKLLLEAGCSFTHRCELGFSPIIWAKIGSKGQISNSGRIILDRIYHHQEETTRNEMIQDIVCYDLAQFLLILQSLKNRQAGEAASIEGDNERLDKAADDDLVISFMLEAFGFASQSAVVDVRVSNTTSTSNSNIDEEAELSGSINVSHGISILEAIHMHLKKSLSPLILSKMWMPKDDVHQDYQTALMAALPAERYWLQIMTSAVRGPQSTTENSTANQSKSAESDEDTPPLFTLPGLDFYVLSLYKSYRDLIQYPVSNHFSYFTPTIPIVNQLLDLSTSITFIESHPSNKESSNERRHNGTQFWIDVFDSYRSKTANTKLHETSIKRVTLGLWDDDAIDLGLLSLTKNFSAATISNSTTDQSAIRAESTSANDLNVANDVSKMTSNPSCLVFLMDSIINENLLRKSHDERIELFQSVGQTLCEQFEICYEGYVVIIGATAKESCEPLLWDKSLLIHEFTTVLTRVFSNSKTLTFSKKMSLPSWPFEESVASIFTCRME